MAKETIVAHSIELEHFNSVFNAIYNPGQFRLIARPKFKIGVTVVAANQILVVDGLTFFRGLLSILDMTNTCSKIRPLAVAFEWPRR